MWCFWSGKGGVGCTVVAAGVALAMAADRPTLLVDLGGDLPAVFGCQVDGPGLVDWLAAPGASPDALSRLEVEAGPNLAVLPWLGSGRSAAPDRTDRTDPDRTDPDRPGEQPPDLWGEPFDILARVIALDHRQVVVDLGHRADRPATIDEPSVRDQLIDRLLSLGTRSTLVTRPCYLAIRAAEQHPSPDEVIVVGRQTRALGSADVERALGVPVVASVRWDPAVARAVDAGLVASRHPRALRSLASLVSAVAA